MTPAGRLVVLDFGIVSELDQPQEAGPGSRTFGTVQYMAPEQSAGEVTAAADWYSVGVLLYQALTGRLPFSGSSEQILNAKRSSEPPPVHTLQPWAPYALDLLCTELLRRDPAARPKTSQVLERLQVSARVRETPTAQPTSEIFIGRARELAMLSQAFGDSQRGEGVTLLVHGESGVGKSALVRHFLEDAVRRRSVLVLAGRCYERESVPYKALDAVIDRLALHLGRLPPETVGELLPPHLPLLAQLFPVLTPLCEGLPSPRISDPIEARNLAFAALRELLTRLARRSALILVIDDLQWADVDSFVLLGVLLRSPRPPFLLIGTVRTKTTSLDTTGALASLPGELRHLSIEKLPESDAHSLVAQLLKQMSLSGDVESLADEIVREANGHPLFIDELVRLRKSHSEKAPLRLDEALWQRVQRLPGPARNLLEVVAVAGVPIPQDLAAQASAIDLSHFDSQVSLLRAARLLRTSGPRRKDTIEPYHDRVRESIQSRLSDKVRRSWHGRLAIALESSEADGSPDPEALLLHWESAGHSDRAATYAVQAAERAAATLAFERAARLYERALSLSGATGERRRELLVRLSEALINQGRGPDAAVLLIEAAEGAPPMRASVLRRQASEQYLRSGRFDEGIALMKKALRDLDIRYPDSTIVSVGSLIFHQLLLNARGHKFKQRDASEVPPLDLNIVDTMRACVNALGSIDPMRGAEITMRMSLRALRTGEPGRVAAALTNTALSVGVMGSESAWREGQRLLAQAKALAEPLPDPYHLAFAVQNDGMMHHVNGYWRKSQAFLDQGEQLLRERCVGVHWELALLRTLATNNYYYLGDFSRLSLLIPQYLEEAERRGDLFFHVCIASYGLPILRLVQDRPEQARIDTAERLARWTYPGPALHKLNALYWTVQSHLYEGRGTLAHQRWTAELLTAYKLMGRSAAILRIMILDLTGRTALMAALEASGSEREALLRKAEKLAAELMREWSPWAPFMGHLLRGGTLAARGRVDEALDALTQAAAGFDAADMKFHAAVARGRHGVLRGGEAGRQEAADAAELLRGIGITNPDRWTRMVAPGLRQ